MSLESFLDKNNMKFSLARLFCYKVRGTNKIKEAGYSAYYNRITKSYGLVNKSNRLVFGGWYEFDVVKDLSKVGNVYFLEHNLKYYTEDGTSYPSLVEVGLNQVKESVAAFGQWEKLYGSCNRSWKTVGNNSAEKAKFLNGIVLHIEGLFKSHRDNPSLLEKTLKQFTDSLEYFVDHPNESTDFVGGGQVR